MTHFCPRTTGSLHLQRLWTATHHQGLGAPGHHDSQGHQQHPMPFIPHMSIAHTPLYPIPLYPGPFCPMDTQSVPLYTPKYPALSGPPSLTPSPTSSIPCSILPLCTPISCSIPPHFLPNPASRYSHTLLHPALHPCRPSTIPHSSLTPPDSRCPQIPPLPRVPVALPTLFLSGATCLPRNSRRPRPGGGQGSRGSGGESGNGLCRSLTWHYSHNPKRDYGSSGTSGENEAQFSTEFVHGKPPNSQGLGIPARLATGSVPAVPGGQRLPGTSQKWQMGGGAGAEGGGVG